MRRARAFRLLLVVLSAALACACSASKPRSVVCIVVDTLRADHLGAYGYRAHPTTPRLDAWLARGQLYEQAFAASPWTLPSMGSIYSARWPVHHGAGRWARFGKTKGLLPLRPEAVTVAERFQEAGFATAAIVNNHFLASTFGMDQGFGVYDFDASTNEHGRRADEVVRRALAWLDQRGPQPFLLLVQLFDPHMDYDAPPPFRGRFSDGVSASMKLPVTDGRALRKRLGELTDADRQFVGAAYDEEVAFVDEQLGVLLDGLEQRGLFREALVALTADHGEELFDHGSFEHGHSVFQELIHVPLAFWGPGVRPGREPAPVSLVDLAPTLLDAVGLPPLSPADGVSLWPNLTAGAPLSKRVLYAEGLLLGREQKAVIDWPEKLVWLPRRDTWVRFDLSKDPGEQQALQPDGAPAEQSMQREAVALWSTRPSEGPDTVAPIDAVTGEALKKLGYVE